MFCTSISWFICTFVAVAVAIGYNDQDCNTEPDSDVLFHRVRICTGERYPNAAVELGELLGAGDEALVTLVAGDTRLVAHRAVLAARSPALLRDASAGAGEVAVEGTTLRALLAYVYTLQPPPLLPALEPQLLAAAHRYELSALKQHCERQLAGRLSVQTAAATAVLAVANCCDTLTRAAVAFIRAHISQVMRTHGWADAIRDQPEVWSQVIRLLSKPPPAINSPSSAEIGYSDGLSLNAALHTIPQTDNDEEEEEEISHLWSLSADEKGRRLLEAAKEGDVGELEALLAVGANVRARDGENRTALHWAAIEGHAEAARRLVWAGAATDARDGWSRTPLHWAVLRGGAAAVRALLASGARHTDADWFGRTPLHLAATHGRADEAEALLQAGADLQAADSGGRTPLQLATWTDNHQLVELLQAWYPPGGQPAGWEPATT